MIQRTFRFSFFTNMLLIVPLFTVLSAEKNEDLTFEEQHRQAVSKNPEGIDFTIRLKNTTLKYFQGELIPLDCTISCNTPGVADVYNFFSNNPMQPGDISFHLTPSDNVVDPLLEYNESDPYFVKTVSGAFMSNKVTEKPLTFTVFLNSKLRFDKPGTFKLYVIFRVDNGTLHHLREMAKDYREAITSSNTVEFEVIPPDPIWLNKILKNAAYTVESNYSQVQINVPHAGHALRSLYTKDAAREIIRLLGVFDNATMNEVALGLAGSPYQEFVITEMERCFTAPDYPVTSRFMEILNRLKWMAVKREQKPEEKDQKQEKNKNIMTFTDQDFIKNSDSTWKQLASNVMKKEGKALAVSLYTLIKHKNTTDSFIDSSEFQTVLKQFPEKIASLFDELSYTERERLLKFNWRYIAGPAMLPLLRTMIQTLQPDDFFTQNRDVVVKRFYELAPEEGRPIILDEMKKTRPNLSIESLGLLPEKTLPEYDEIFVNNFIEKKMDTVCFLIERYASPAIYPRIKKIFQTYWHTVEGTKADCALLAYCMRYDPDFVAQSIRELLAKQDGKPYLYQDKILENVADYSMCPEIEEIALECLDDPRMEIVRGALGILTRHGSAKAEHILWQRYKELNEKWKDRQNDYQELIDNSKDRTGLESRLFNTLVRGHGWHIDQQKISELKKISLLDDTRDKADRFMDMLSNPPTIGVSVAYEKIMFNIGLCNDFFLDNVESKLIQYPSGTVFHWEEVGGRNLFGFEEECKNAYERIKRFLEEHEMSLEIPDTEDDNAK